MYDRLIPELRDDPANVGYSAMTDEQAAAALNAVTQPARRLVPLWQVKKTCIESGAWLAILQAAQSHADQQVQGAAALTAIYVDDSRFENLDMDLPSTQQMLGALVAGGVVSAELAAAIAALADTPTSRAAIIGLSGISSGHIESARTMMGG